MCILSILHLTVLPLLLSVFHGTIMSAEVIIKFRVPFQTDSSSITAPAVRGPCRPLTSLQELLQWTEEKACHNLAKKRKVTKALFRSNGERMKDAENTPRLMICHDMKGGYQEDR